MEPTSEATTTSTEEHAELLDRVLDQSTTEVEQPATSSDLRFGRLFFSDGKTWVDLDDERCVEIRSSLVAESELVSERVAVMLDSQNQAIIVGVLHDPPRQIAEVTAVVDGETKTLKADREIRLECGKASISLRNDGRVLIRGTYVCSRASGPNKIKGGSIQLN